jgi:hypothetical protein
VLGIVQSPLELEWVAGKHCVPECALPCLR